VALPSPRFPCQLPSIADEDASCGNAAARLVTGSRRTIFGMVGAWTVTIYLGKLRAGLLESVHEGRKPHMIKLSLARLAVVVGCMGLSLSAGAGIASADPDFGPMINTTCTYSQAMAALNAQNPTAARLLDQSPPNQTFLRQFIASSPDQRVQLIDQVKNNPGAREAFPVIQQMFATCNNY
jgi:hemophore-related protein